MVAYITLLEISCHGLIALQPKEDLQNCKVPGNPIFATFLYSNSVVLFEIPVAGFTNNVVGSTGPCS